MAYSGSVITAEFINNLKSLINAECTRRNKTGSVSSYGSGNWAKFSKTVAADNVIYHDMAEKLFTPINKISGAVSVPGQGDAITIDTLYDEYTRLHGFSEKYNSSTGCSASCTGFCSSCSGTCSGTCSGGCSSCSGSCSGGCSGACWTACSWSCTDSCNSNCSTSCWSCAATGSSNPCGAAYNG